MKKDKKKMSAVERIRNSAHFRKYKKLYYSSFIATAAIVVFCTVYALILPAITLATQSATVVSHPTLSYQMYSNVTKTKRAYLEYALPGTRKSETFGILRQSVLYVYAYAGETICLGSDVTRSYIDENDVLKSDPTGVDILMIGPDGTKYTFDNDEETGLGFINTYTQEEKGANFENSNNTGGYKPHEFKVRKTGLYEVRFHSYYGDAFKFYADGYPHLRRGANLGINGTAEGQSNDPSHKPFKNNTWANSGNTVGAFDITVINNGEVKPGRTYADYLALNIGVNTSGKNTAATLYGDFYIVTSDGYIYKSDFELDPFGFIFFANSRGVVSTESGYSAYKSVRARSQDSNAQMVMTNIPYTVFTPQHEATELDKTYMIFFEEPDSALQGILYQRAFAPGMATNLEFIGSKEGNITYVGNGGYFKFDVENAISATITISFEAYNEQHGTSYENVEIKANVTKGTNYIYWDGNDKNGQEIPVGWYRNGYIDIEVQTHAGEIHFPFLDIENGTDLTFERINSIYSYVDGVLTDVSDLYEDDRYTIYYDNTILPDSKNSPVETVIADGLDCSRGTDSSVENTMYYVDMKGDFTILDIWAHAVAKSSMEITTDLIVEDLDGYYTVNLNGLVFFDKNRSTNYDIAGGDFVLPNVEVSLDYFYCGTRWIITTDPEDSSKITRLDPVPHTSAETGENGNIVEVVDYYYHGYEVILQDDGLYHLYHYDYTDHLHTGATSEVLDASGNPVTVSIYTTQETDEESGEQTTKYLVWIPVHRETTTDALGKYYFSGLLVNEKMYEMPLPEYNNITVTVKNPDPEVYSVTTTQAITGDFNTTGTETQVITMTTLQQKITADTSGAKNFFYSMADVGYYYETYEPPITLAKHWGTIQDSNNIEKLTLNLQGYTEKDGVKTVRTNKTITLTYYSWFITLTDLPASIMENNEKLMLSYRVTSEEFVRFENGLYYKYKYTYYWDADPAYSEYTVIRTDSTGTPIEDAESEDLNEEQYPFETYIAPIEHLITGDRITVENWASDTTKITLVKYGAEDNVTTLPLATFKLQKLTENETTHINEFTDVYTDLGLYTVTTDNNGIAVFRGLSDGTYRLVETVAPEYYDISPPIVFVVSKTEGTDNTAVTGTYEEGYSTNVYDQLLEQPVSVIHKFDQYGDIIPGAEFTIYKADENYNYDPLTDVVYIDDDQQIPAVITVQEDGSAVLLKKLSDGSTRPMYISELNNLLGNTNRFVIAETKVPPGYRAVGDAHMRIIGSGLASSFICDNTFDSGVRAEPIATAYAPEILQVANMSQISNISSAGFVNAETGEVNYIDYTDNGRISGRGTLFAMILKRNREEPEQANIKELTFEDWKPIYGNATGGFHTVSDPDMSHLERVVEAIKQGGAYEFNANTDGTLMFTTIVDFPSTPERYFTYRMINNLPSIYNDQFNYYSDPQYAVLYYYSTAETLEEVTATNTARVTSHGLYNNADKFTIHFSADIQIPDIANTLYLQKTDVTGNLINNASFALYNAVATANGTGYYVGKDGNEDPVYITLGENDEKEAHIYSGTLDENGVLTPGSEIATGTYSFDTTGCPEVSTLTKKNILDAEGYVTSTANASANTGVITITTEGGGTYKIIPARDATDRSVVCFTHTDCKYIVETGTAHMSYLTNGKYYVREIYAPNTLDLNYTNIEVFVGEQEIYANAGDIDDGVMVGNGAGYLVSTLNTYASIGEIDETLSYITCMLHLPADESLKDGFADLTLRKTWPYVSLDQNNTTKYIFTGSEPKGDIMDSTALYLMYNGSASNNQDDTRHTLFDYTVNPDGLYHPENLINSLMFWTETNWSDLAIFQHVHAKSLEAAIERDANVRDISLKGEEPNDISNLFSSSTFVRVEDTAQLGLQIRKISSSNSSRLQGASFVLFTQDEESGLKLYYTPDGNGGSTFEPLADGVSEATKTFTTNENGIIDFGSIENGTYYLKEVSAPYGYMPLRNLIKITVAEGKIVAEKDNGAAVNVAAPTKRSPDGTWVYSVVVLNDIGYELPATGGLGIPLMYTIGSLLILAAAVVYGYYFRRRRERRNE